jgi:hypothetical protein
VARENHRSFSREESVRKRDFSIVSRNINEKFIVIRAPTMFSYKHKLLRRLAPNASANKPCGEITRHLFHLKLKAHSSSDLIFRRTVEPSMNLHHSPRMTATPAQDSFSNHHTVSRASIGAESVSLQGVALSISSPLVQWTLRSRHPPFSSQVRQIPSRTSGRAAVDTALLFLEKCAAHALGPSQRISFDRRLAVTNQRPDGAPE